MGNYVYLRKLVEEFHSATVATIGADGHLQTRVIDMMLWDDKGVYFLTAKGKEFYRQIMQQQFIAVSATKEKAAVSLRGKVKNIGTDRLDDFDISDPAHVARDSILIGNVEAKQTGYFVGQGCIGCKLCEALSVSI